jgi:chromosome segregation ATPase
MGKALAVRSKDSGFVDVERDMAEVPPAASSDAAVHVSQAKIWTHKELVDRRHQQSSSSLENADEQAAQVVTHFLAASALKNATKGLNVLECNFKEVTETLVKTVGRVDMARAEVEEERAKAACNRQDLSSAMVNIRHQETSIETLRSDVGQLTWRTKTLQASKNYLRGLVHAKDYEILALQADVANHKILFSRMEKLISDRDAQERQMKEKVERMSSVLSSLHAKLGALECENAKLNSQLQETSTRTKMVVKEALDLSSSEKEELEKTLRHAQIELESTSNDHRSCVKPQRELSNRAIALKSAVLLMEDMADQLRGTRVENYELRKSIIEDQVERSMSVVLPGSVKHRQSFPWRFLQKHHSTIVIFIRIFWEKLVYNYISFQAF